MKVIVCFVSFFLLTSCLNGSGKVEKQSFDCLTDLYASKGVDLNTKLQQLENDMIDAQIIKGKDGASYINFFEELKKSEKYPDISNIDTGGLYVLTNEEVRSCMESLTLLGLIVNEMKTEGQKIMDMNTTIISNAYLNHLSPSDFEEPAYKFFTLYSLFASNIEPFNHDENGIRIEVYSSEIRVDGEDVSLKELDSYLNGYKSDFQEKDFLKINVLLMTDDEVPDQLFLKIEKLLIDNGLFNISYTSVE